MVEKIVIACKIQPLISIAVNSYGLITMVEDLMGLISYIVSIKIITYSINSLSLISTTAVLFYFLVNFNINMYLALRDMYRCGQKSLADLVIE